MVKLDEDIEGFVPLEQLGKPEITKPQEAFSEGDMLPLRVVEFDRSQRKVVLSVSAYFKGREKAELEAFLGKHPTKTIKVEELVEERPKLEEQKKEKEEEGIEEEKESPKEALPSGDEPVTDVPDKEEESKDKEE